MIEGQRRTIRVLRIANHDVILGDLHCDAATFVRQRREFEAFFLEGIWALRVSIVHIGPPESLTQLSDVNIIVLLLTNVNIKNNSN